MKTNQETRPDNTRRLSRDEMIGHTITMTAQDGTEVILEYLPGDEAMNNVNMGLFGRISFGTGERTDEIILSQFRCCEEYKIVMTAKDARQFAQELLDFVDGLEALEELLEQRCV